MTNIPLGTWTWACVSVLEMANLPLVHLDQCWCVCIGNDESSSCSPGPEIVCLYWKWRIFLLFTWTRAGVSVLEMTNLPLVHMDLRLVCLYWKLRIFLLITSTWAGVSVLEMTNLPLVHLDLGWCVCIGNDKSSSYSPGPGLVCLYWK